MTATTMKKRSDFEPRFLALASDGKHRTVKQIREALSIPATINVGECLRIIQTNLAGSERTIRLRCTTLRTEAHQKVWWVEVKS